MAGLGLRGHSFDNPELAGAARDPKDVAGHASVGHEVTHYLGRLRRMPNESDAPDGQIGDAVRRAPPVDDRPAEEVLATARDSDEPPVDAGADISNNGGMNRPLRSRPVAAMEWAVSAANSSSLVSDRLSLRSEPRSRTPVNAASSAGIKSR